MTQCSETTACHEDEVNDGDIWDGVDNEEVQDDFRSEDIDSQFHALPDSPGSPIKSSLLNLVRLLTTLLAKWSAFYKLSDSSLTSLLKLLSFFFHLLAKLFSPMAVMAKLFPSSVHRMNKFCGTATDGFEKLVVCPSCHSIYQYQDCIETIGTQKVPKACSFIAFPNHPHAARRKACNGKLLAEVTLSNGRKHFYPKKVFCYTSVISSLTTLLEREGILKSCELWRQRSIPEGTLGDIYDGKVWKDFLYVDGQPFLASPHNLGLILNIDWFNPYKHSPYSVGAIYLVVLNLPRTERYKVENLILVGIIPGPSEPPLNLNSYMEPLVEELLQLWDCGIKVSSGDVSDIVVKAALLCVSCDTPAVRKVCGFLGHSARRGCSKCTREFECSHFGEKPCYAGFEECPLRNEETHRLHAQEALDESTATGRAEVERAYGDRYTVLMQLPYFDCVRCHTIDPMHNLFLGTARHMVKDVWLSESAGCRISKSNLLEMQKRVDSCQIPSSMGHIPNKI